MNTRTESEMLEGLRAELAEVGETVKSKSAVASAAAAEAKKANAARSKALEAHAVVQRQHADAEEAFASATNPSDQASAHVAIGVAERMMRASAATVVPFANAAASASSIADEAAKSLEASKTRAATLEQHIALLEKCDLGALHSRVDPLATRLLEQIEELQKTGRAIVDEFNASATAAADFNRAAQPSVPLKAPDSAHCLLALAEALLARKRVIGDEWLKELRQPIEAKTSNHTRVTAPVLVGSPGEFLDEVLRLLDLSIGAPSAETLEARRLLLAAVRRERTLGAAISAARLEFERAQREAPSRASLIERAVDRVFPSPRTSSEPEQASAPRAFTMPPRRGVPGPLPSRGGA